MSKEGSILGGSLLIAGSMIGAGMLGLPILTGLAGFFPSLAMFIITAVFMTITGFLLSEVNGWHPSHVNILTMVDASFGKKGKIICWIFYLFLLYSLLVAYVAASGGMVSTLCHKYFNISFSPSFGSIFFVILFGILIYRGTREVDLVNRVLMFFKISFFGLLVILGARFMQSDKLLYQNPAFMIATIPILITSFGYHNMIPSLTRYMNGNMKKVRQSILIGCLFSLSVYLIWQILSLGILPLQGPNGIESSLHSGKDASQSLEKFLGASWVGNLAMLLGFVAILTSFLAQSLSLSHFLADGLKITYKRHENIAMCVLTLFPPLLLGCLFPSIFFKALNFAGGFCTVILFGILPSLMVWHGRYHKKEKSQFQVIGGKPLLFLVMAFSLFIFFYQLIEML